MFFVKELSGIFTWADNSCKHEIIIFNIYLFNGSRMKAIPPSPGEGELPSQFVSVSSQGLILKFFNGVHSLPQFIIRIYPAFMFQKSNLYHVLCIMHV